MKLSLHGLAMTIREGRRRGNPNWGKQNVPIAHLVADGQTAFEKVVSELGLEPSRFATSRKLKAWVLEHYNQRYVPEDLLQAWNLHPRTENFG